MAPDSHRDVQSLIKRYTKASESIAQNTLLDVENLDSSALAVTSLLVRQAKRVATWNKSVMEKDAALKPLEYESLLKVRLHDVASIATSKFYAYRYDQLPEHWRSIYTETMILLSNLDLLSAASVHEGLAGDALGSIVGHLDRALITAGGFSKNLDSSWVERTLGILGDVWQRMQRDEEKSEPATKRRKVGSDPSSSFPSDESHGRPTVKSPNECPRHAGWTITALEDYMLEGDGKPVVFTDLIEHWPALTTNPWQKPCYLLSKTIGGRRLVPVEVGRSYVDDGWGQELVPFDNFLARFISCSTGHDADVGYLAQHDLFTQIPSLRTDIAVPDLCWATMPPHPLDASKNQPQVDVPHVNAWFGPSKTITPLHTDGYHNLLCQVVGTKYVRLYPPQATASLKPRQKQDGIDMSNTSEFDVGVMEGWDDPPEDTTEELLENDRRHLNRIEYRECILGPGEALLIPIGWWHYVRSLSISFSVSFWWN